MSVLLLTDTPSPGNQERLDLMLQEFQAAGAVAETAQSAVSLRELTGPGPGTTAGRRESWDRLARQFAGRELIVYVTDEVTIADAGGHCLRQAASWAQAAAAPLILVAGSCSVSTRQFRAMGVEAGYEVRTPAEARRVVQTWV